MPQPPLFLLGHAHDAQANALPAITRSSDANHKVQDSVANELFGDNHGCDTSISEEPTPLGEEWVVELWAFLLGSLHAQISLAHTSLNRVSRERSQIWIDAESAISALGLAVSTFEDRLRAPALSSEAIYDNTKNPIGNQLSKTMSTGTSSISPADDQVVEPVSISNECGTVSISNESLAVRHAGGENKSPNAGDVSSRAMTPQGLRSISQLRLRRIWMDHVDIDIKSLVAEAQADSGSGQNTEYSQAIFSKYGDIMQSSNNCLRRMVIRPSSPTHLFIDLLSAFVISYDLLSLPLQTFKYDKLAVARRLRIITTIYWTFEMPLSFFEGHIEHGRIEMRVVKIAKTYARTWFVPSLIIVICDWLLIIADSSDQHSQAITVARAGKVFRFLRVLRFLRMMRVMKLASLLDTVGDYIFSATSNALFGVIKPLMFVGAFCHFVGCIYHALGVETAHTSGHERGSWVDSFSQNQTMFERYAVSFHWAFSQFTPAPPPNSTSPRNITEQLYVISLLFFGLVLFSAFMGSVTANLTGAKQVAEKKLRQKVLFKRYVHEHGVSLELGHHILFYVRMSNKVKPDVIESDVDALSDLPPTLHARLRFEVNAPILIRHPFFDFLLQLYPTAFREVCYVAIQHTCFQVGQELFHRHSEAKTMFFIFPKDPAKPRDVISYYRVTAVKRSVYEMVGQPTPSERSLKFSSNQSGARNSQSKQGQDLPKHVQLIKEGDWFGECAIWLCSPRQQGDGWWQYKGLGRVRNSCQSAVLDAEQFHRIALRHPTTLQTMREYAQLYLTRLAEAIEHDQTVSADLFGSDQELGEIVRIAFPYARGRCTGASFESDLTNKTPASRWGRAFSESMSQLLTTQTRSLRTAATLKSRSQTALTIQDVMSREGRLQ